MTKKIDLSIILTAHAEGLLAHKTINSLFKACALLSKQKYTYEIIVSIDSGSPETQDYFERYKQDDRFRILKVNYRDLGQSRNNAIKHAKGDFITTIDADDLMTANWLVDGLKTLKTKPYGQFIAHTEMTVEFGGAKAVVQKYPSTNRDQDILLSVWSGRWNSIIMAPRNLFKTHHYPKLLPGYGYEDWHLSLDFLQNNLTCVLIPETAIFVRRKTVNSEWQRQISSRSVLPAHPVFKPLFFKNISLDNIKIPSTQVIRQRNNLIKERLKKVGIPVKPFILAKKIKQKLQASNRQKNLMPEWLKREYLTLHKIEKQIFPPEIVIDIYHTITDDNYQVGLAYWQICQKLRRDKYDYVLFVPWLQPGGADLFAINYANYFAKIGLKVVVVATNETEQDSTWASKLDQAVDFLPFGHITKNFWFEQKYRLLEHLIENTEIEIIHILNSELGYDFVRDHEKYLAATNKKIIATAYSQSSDASQRIFGFSHTHIPQIYNQLSFITTDNQPIKDVWLDEYAYDPNKILVHHQPFDAAKIPIFNKKTISKKILWASRLAPEKIPNIVVKIADLLPKDIVIDMYGRESDDFPKNSLQLSDKVNYKGNFNSLSDIPINNYDLFLYTSLFDGMPNVPVEMALSGIPIIASKVGGLVSLLKNDKLLVVNNLDENEYAKKINILYDDYQAALKSSQKLRSSLLKLHSSDTFTEELENLLKNLAN